MKKDFLICTEEQAVAEANRCLHCFEAPCSKGCPVNVNVPTFVARIRTEDWKGAADTILENNPLGFVCGLVCPAEELCMKNCNKGKLEGPISIPELQAFAVHKALTSGFHKGNNAKRTGRVAVIGGGPSGLAAAVILSRDGFDVALFEKKEHIGGVPEWEIPKDRLDKQLWDIELKQLATCGMTIKTGVNVDETLAEQIVNDYDAVYIACGLGEVLPSGLKKNSGVISAEEFLSRYNQGQISINEIGTDVIVQGGGNTAIDAAMCAKKLGCDRVYLCYRRSKTEMPAWEAEYLKAAKDGVEFLWQRQITDVEAKCGKLESVILSAVKLEDADNSGRRYPTVDYDHSITLKASTIITAFGRDKNDKMKDLFKSAKKSGKVFYGGDIVNGGSTVVQAVADAKAAVVEIEQFLS